MLIRTHRLYGTRVQWTCDKPRGQSRGCNVVHHCLLSSFQRVSLIVISPTRHTNLFIMIVLWQGGQEVEDLYEWYRQQRSQSYHTRFEQPPAAAPKT